MIWGRIKCPEQSLSAAQRPPARKLSLSVLNADRLIMFRAILRLIGRNAYDNRAYALPLRQRAIGLFGVNKPIAQECQSYQPSCRLNLNVRAKLWFCISALNGADTYYVNGFISLTSRSNRKFPEHYHRPFLHPLRLAGF